MPLFHHLGRRCLLLASSALILWALHPHAARELLCRRPTTLHCLELACYFGGRFMGLLLRLLRVLCEPLNRVPALFKLRAWVLRFWLQVLKAVAPAFHALLMERPSLLDPVASSVDPQIAPPPPQNDQESEKDSEDTQNYASNLSTITEPPLADSDTTPLCPPLPDVAFQGCSWLLPYHIGVAQKLIEEKLLTPSTSRVAGASSGSLVAVAVACGVDLRELQALVLKMAADSRASLFGPVGAMSHYVRTGLDNLLPRDALQRLGAGGRLQVSVTRFAHDHEEEEEEEGGEEGTKERVRRRSSTWLRNEVISSWESREELIQCLLGSCFIPLYYEHPPLHPSPSHPTRPYQRQLGLDGGASNNLPRALVQVSPNCECVEAEIKPSFHDCVWAPISSLFPAEKAALEGMYRQGYEDAGRFLGGREGGREDKRRKI